MVKNDRNLPSDDRQIQHLLESNLIHKSQQTSAKTSLYKINRQVKKPLFKFIKNEQENYLDNLLIENNTSTLRFISLFYDIEIEFGTKESNQLMPHNIYILSLSLIDQHIITKKDTTNTQNKSTVVRFELDTYAEQLISKRIFHKRPARHILELNLNYVLGSGATGGGAVGNGYTF